jgi:hypothetical protein
VAINSYFYDSVNGDRPYSAGDFAQAFSIVAKTGVLANENEEGAMGFDIGGTNYLTIYEGKAVLEGHFVEVTDTETLTVPAGSYAGQVVIRVDMLEARAASIVVKTDRTPIQTGVMYELPLYDADVVNGIITKVADVRVQGGTVPNNHTHKISEVEALQETLDKSVTWLADPNGVKAIMGKFGGTGKNVVLFLTTAQPAANTTEHRVWIQIDNF